MANYAATSNAQTPPRDAVRTTERQAPKQTVQPKPQAKPKAGPFYIPSLDGIRALSIAIVFVAHAGLGHLVPGGFGVTIFFFLSGYLITTLMRMEADATGTVSLKNFYLRRILRIFPPFYLAFVLLYASVSLGLLHGSLQAQPVLMQLFYLGNYQQIYFPDGVAAGSAVLWSLAIEEHFYLFFPLFYLALRRLTPNGKHQAFIMIGLCALVLLWRVALVYGVGASADRIYYGTDTRLDALLFGCILAVWGNPVLDPAPRSTLWLRVSLPLAGVMLLLSLLVRAPAFRETLRYSLQGVALFPIFIAALRFSHHRPWRWLNVPWIRFVGVLSYSLYLVHHAIVHGIRQHLHVHPLLQGLVAFALALGIAVIFHYTVEKPSAALRKRLSFFTSPTPTKDRDAPINLSAHATAAGAQVAARP